MAKRDYYEILGINKKANVDEIKSVYRRLAKQYHPDMNPNNRKESEEKFKELSEAYEVLIDNDKRNLYDQYGHEGVSQRFSPGGFQWRDFSHAEDLRDVFGDVFDFSQIFRGLGEGSIFDLFAGQRTTRSTKTRGRDIHVHLRLTLEEIAEGVSKQISFPRYEKCETCKGIGGTDSIACPSCQGRGEKKHITRSMFGQFVQISACPDCQGEGKVIKNKCGKCTGEGRVRIERTIKVTIPAGVSNGNFMQLRGEGHYGPGGKGNVVVEIEEKEHPLFIRNGDNIVVEMPIPITTAVLGGEIEIPTMDGKKKHKLNPGIQSGEIIRIKNAGIKRLNGGRGDELIRIAVHTPKHLSAQEKNLLKEWERIRSESVPEPRKPQ